MKRLFVILAVLIFAVVMLTGCAESATTDTSDTGDSSDAADSSDETYLIGYSNKSSDDLFTKYVQDIFVELVDADSQYEVTVTDGANDVNAQLNQIDLFITQEVDAIVVVPVDDEGIIPGIEAANAAGIPVISLIAKSGGGEYVQIGTVPYEAGELQAEAIADMLPENAKYVYLEGLQGMSEATGRFEGFTETIAELRPDVELIANQTGNWMRDEGMALMEDWIQAFEQIDAVISANDQMALGAIQALKAADRLDGVIVTGVDATYDACVAIDDGEMTMSCYQDGPAEAEAAFETAKALIAGEEVESEIWIPFVAVNADNVQDWLDMYVEMGYGE